MTVATAYHLSFFHFIQILLHHVIIPVDSRPLLWMEGHVTSAISSQDDANSPALYFRPTLSFS